MPSLQPGFSGPQSLLFSSILDESRQGEASLWSWPIRRELHDIIPFDDIRLVRIDQHGSIIRPIPEGNDIGLCIEGVEDVCDAARLDLSEAFESDQVSRQSPRFGFRSASHYPGNGQPLFFQNGLDNRRQRRGGHDQIMPLGRKLSDTGYDRSIEGYTTGNVPPGGCQIGFEFSTQHPSVHRFLDGRAGTAPQPAPFDEGKHYAEGERRIGKGMIEIDEGVLFDEGFIEVGDNDLFIPRSVLRMDQVLQNVDCANTESCFVGSRRSFSITFAMTC